MDFLKLDEDDIEALGSVTIPWLVRGLLAFAAIISGSLTLALAFRLFDLVRG